LEQEEQLVQLVLVLQEGELKDVLLVLELLLQQEEVVVDVEDLVVLVMEDQEDQEEVQEVLDLDLVQNQEEQEILLQCHHLKEIMVDQVLLVEQMLQLVVVEEQEQQELRQHLLKQDQEVQEQM